MSYGGCYENPFLAAFQGLAHGLSSLSETEEVMAAMASNGDDNMYNDLQNSLDCLRQVVSERFVKLHTDLEKLQFEFKTEIEAVKISIKDIEKASPTLTAKLKASKSI